MNIKVDEPVVVVIGEWDYVNLLKGTGRWAQDDARWVKVRVVFVFAAQTKSAPVTKLGLRDETLPLFTHALASEQVFNRQLEKDFLVSDADEAGFWNLNRIGYEFGFRAKLRGDEDEQ
ncbi:hypothetical protein PIB30_056413 [Stylosanthes scabra]|uniref:Uncharacterized protein n=1 Tax=Stylosanthes scabra TaxID=79078 RepID=A0ABU6YJZ6_9FABA|nr:hypothetical protein [Stylosanthes scabra]